MNQQSSPLTPGMSMPRQPRPAWRLGWVWLALLLASALIGIIAILYVTRQGAGAAGDSVHYLQGAANLLDGIGYSRLRGDGTAVPQTAFPPGFSLALAVLGMAGLPGMEAARWLNAFLMGLNILLIGLLIYRASRSGVLAVLGGWLYLYADAVVRLHAWVMSEPLFISLSLLALLALDRYLESSRQGGQRWVLVLAGLITGLAALTRYAGLALIPTAMVATYFFTALRAQASIKGIRRWIDSLIIGSVSLFPVAIWFVRNVIVSSSLANRSLGFHPISKDLIFALFNEIAFYWFAPSLSVPWRLRLLLLGLFIAAGLGVYATRYSRWIQGKISGAVSALPGTLATYGFFYLVLLLINTSFLDASTDEPGIKRYAIPFITVGIIWTLTSFSQPVNLTTAGWSQPRKLFTNTVLALVGLGLVVFYASRSVPFILHPGYSFGYTDARQSWTCEVETSKSIDPQRLMITNDYELFYFLADRPAFLVPNKFNQYQGKAMEDYTEKREMIVELLRNGAVLATLGSPDTYSREVNGLVSDLGLEIWKECSNTRFYVMPEYLEEGK